MEDADLSKYGRTGTREQTRILSGSRDVFCGALLSMAFVHPAARKLCDMAVGTVDLSVSRVSDVLSETDQGFEVSTTESQSPELPYSTFPSRICAVAESRRARF